MLPRKEENGESVIVFRSSDKDSTKITYMRGRLERVEPKATADDVSHLVIHEGLEAL
jgi:hypothetical protein